MSLQRTSKKQSTFPEFSHSEHTRFWYHTTNPNTPTDLIAALQFNPTPNNKHAFLGIILRLMGLVTQPRRGFESTHTARLARRFSSSLAPISTASQNATKMIHFLGAFLRTMMPLAPMLGHYTTTMPRKSLSSTVDPRRSACSVAAENEISSRAKKTMPLQLQRTLVDGIPSDILSTERACGDSTKPPNQTFRDGIFPRGRYSPLTSNMTAPLSSCSRPSSMILRSMPQHR